MKLIKNNKQGGFTIIETMISISLFIVIVMIGMDALLNAGLLHQKAQDMRSILDSINYSMDDMSRNLRTGSNYRCINSSGDLSSGVIDVPLSGASCWGIAFQASDGTEWVYYVGTNGIDTNEKLFKATQGPYQDTSSYVQMTPNQVVISNVNNIFSVLGAEAPSSGNNRQQPLVNIRLSGTVTSQNLITPFSVQTSVSQRLLNR